MTPSAFETLISSRRSVRSFTGAAVPRTDLAKILKLARMAPSGANLQPGKFHVLTGAPFKVLQRDLLTAIEEGRAQVSEYSYFPRPMGAELKAKQRAAGYALYSALNIDRRDIEGRKAQFERNYRFFDAPVGVVVTIRRDMGKGCFMDLGMALMALFLAVEDMGYAACGLGALSNYGDVVHRSLTLPDEDLVVCGIAIGVADTSAPVNQFRTERDGLEDFARFYGFET